jgi:YidC/Oxa1 family membrane protein insertase
MQNDQRNLIAFFVLAGLIFILYETFILGPQAKLQAAARAKAEVVQTLATPQPDAPRLNRVQALAQSPRVRIDTPALAGSLSLKGARIDDLFLKGYHEEVSKSSPLVELLRPEGMPDAYFAQNGWVDADVPGMPNADTVWTQTSTGDLTPTNPLVLTYTASGGLAFTRTITVDAKAMFTIADTISNHGAAPVTIAPFASVQRIGLPAGLDKSNIVHEGAIGELGDDHPILRLKTYKKWKKEGDQDWHWPSKGGWFGITDKYWMTVFIPNQSEHIDGKLRFKDGPDGSEMYEAVYVGDARTIAPGSQIQHINRMFAGAKTVPLLNAYKHTLGVPAFDDAVDWGFLMILTKPIFTLLEYFYQHVGNFGVAILMLTVVIRLITFPLANKGYEMGVKMKKLQPELQALQKKNKDDPAAQQKEMMALYAREKVNPVTGCLPVLFQIPVFYSLTKIFTVTIEMRHAPFFGWIHDLSARDPTTIMNLFGLIPWDPAMTPLIGGILGGPLHVGVWPIAYGLSMWLSQSMTPTQGIDPTQQMLFKFMPFVFTFILAQYAVGLLIYWAWSSLITVLQQYVMMRRFKVENPIDKFLERFSTKSQESG